MNKEDIREIISVIQESVAANPTALSNDPKVIKRFNAFVNLAIAVIQNI